MEEGKRLIWFRIGCWILLIVAVLQFPVYGYFNNRIGPWPFDQMLGKILPVFLPIICLVIHWTLVSIAAATQRTRMFSQQELGWMTLISVVVGLMTYAAPGFFEYTGRQYSTTKVLLWATAGDIEDSYREEGRLPESLGELDQYGRLTDPYSSVGSKLSWYVLGATTGLLLSVGQDGLNQYEMTGEKIEYRLQNGKFSKGDILQEVEIK